MQIKSEASQKYYCDNLTTQLLPLQNYSDQVNLLQQDSLEFSEYFTQLKNKHLNICVTCWRILFKPEENVQHKKLKHEIITPKDYKTEKEFTILAYQHMKWTVVGE